MKQEISSFWYTPIGYKGIGLMELLSIKSFLDNKYKFKLYTYNLDDRIFNKLNEIFDNFELKDANEIIPLKNYFSDDRGAGVAAFSDYFRFNMLYKMGGVWVDLDMVCLNQQDLSQEFIFSQEIDDDETKPRITTSFLKFPKGSEFGAFVIKEANEIINNQKTIQWGVIGPCFLAKQVEKYNLKNFTWNYKMTHQIPWCNVKDFIKKSEFDKTQPFLHLYSEMWRSHKLNKNHFYKYGIYGELLKKHQIDILAKEIDFTFSFKDKYHIIFSMLYHTNYYIKHPRRIFIKSNKKK